MHDASLAVSRLSKNSPGEALRRWSVKGCEDVGAFAHQTIQWVSIKNNEVMNCYNTMLDDCEVGL